MMTFASYHIIMFSWFQGSFSTFISEQYKSYISSTFAHIIFHRQLLFVGIWHPLRYLHFLRPAFKNKSDCRPRGTFIWPKCQFMKPKCKGQKFQLSRELKGVSASMSVISTEAPNLLICTVLNFCCTWSTFLRPHTFAFTFCKRVLFTFSISFRSGMNSSENASTTCWEDTSPLQVTRLFRCSDFGLDIIERRPG